MDKLLCVIGAGLVVGVVAYALLSKNNKKEEKSDKIIYDADEKSGDQGGTECNDGNLETDNIENDELDVTKAFEVGTILQRHKEASDIIREAVNNISSNVESDGKEDNDLDQISDELEKMLKEKED